MRPLLLAAAVACVLAAAPAAAAPRAGPPVPVLVVADVGESAQRTMTAALWRKLAAEYVGSRAVTAEDGTALPDDAHCRSVHALYAVLATFERATRLPGLAQDPDRTYGIARFTVRNCLTGAVAPTKTVQVESDPLTAADRGGIEPAAERTWERAVRATLARDPLVLTAAPVAAAVPAAGSTAVPAAGSTAPVAPTATSAPTNAVAPATAPTAAATPATATAPARIARVGNGVVFIERGSGFVVNQILRDYADPSGKPHAVPIEMIVLDVGRKYLQAFVTGKGTPRVGDYVDAAPN